MSSPVTLLEQTRLVAPLGVRFWDVALSAPAGGGLSVTAYRGNWPELIWNAVEGRSGVYSFRSLPGLQFASDGAGDDAYWSANPPTVPYFLNIVDPQERYLPFRLTALLPWRGLTGLFASPLFTSLTPDPTWVPIFSLPSRPVSMPTAVIRAQLLDDTNGLPASGAMMTATSTSGTVVCGIADTRGVISLAMPYPEPRNFALTSPLSGSVKLTDQTWPVEIAVSYTPSGLSSPAFTDLPLLGDLLQQGPAFVWADTSHSASGESFQLRFGNDLILRSFDSATGNPLPVLLVMPAISPL